MLANHEKEGLLDYLQNVHKEKKSKVYSEIIVK